MALQQVHSLLNFYQSEQMWILHAKASLDLANVHQLVIPSASVNLKQEIIDIDLSKENSISSSHPDPSPSSTISPTSPNSKSKPLWERRRKVNKLRLANLDHSRTSKKPRSSESLLHMFANLVDSRIESCHRLARILAKEYDRKQRIAAIHPSPPPLSGDASPLLTPLVSTHSSLAVSLPHQ